MHACMRTGGHHHSVQSYMALEDAFHSTMSFRVNKKLDKIKCNEKNTLGMWCRMMFVILPISLCRK